MSADATMIFMSGLRGLDAGIAGLAAHKTRGGTDTFADLTGSLRVLIRRALP
jgi:hypothetical protein